MLMKYILIKNNKAYNGEEIYEFNMMMDNFKKQ